MSKDKELHISFNFITPKSGFRTGLGNYRNYKDWVTSGFWVDYFTRKDKAVDMSTLDINEELNFLNKSNIDDEVVKCEVLKTYREYLKANIKNAKSGLYGFKNGVFLQNVDVEHIKKRVSKLNVPFYDMVISSNDNMLKNGMIGKESWKRLVEDCLFKWLKSSGLGFDINNLELYYAIHGNTNNPHIHISFWESKIKRNKNRKTFGIQQKIISRKYKELKLDILKKFTIDEDFIKTNELIKKIRDLKINFKKQIIQNENYKNFNEINDLEIKALKNECKINKNKWYSHLTPGSQNTILKIKNELLKNNINFKTIYEDFYSTLNEYKNLKIESKKIQDSFLRTLKKEEREFERKINNTILKEVLKFNTLNLEFKKHTFIKHKNQTKNVRPYSSNFNNLYQKDFSNFNKDIIRLKRLAYQIFEAKNIEEYEKLKGITYE
ncbi:hypothetical protein RRG53_00430 [Mycoplasmopsis cynos]|uniref:hypothetical protein n=1 Tax=Mycoplasmopsis cynos TaxID=171284 RepID=UPI002AFE1301|nr:hypothetical protein [Mycoplasmopsis cynos]WQQ18529.1 hypothetical protein RRG53_00430 [Mycoplasmopsis cynos]